MLSIPYPLVAISDNRNLLLIWYEPNHLFWLVLPGKLSALQAEEVFAQTGKQKRTNIHLVGEIVA
jgi:hypothetical protein